MTSSNCVIVLRKINLGHEKFGRFKGRIAYQLSKVEVSAPSGPQTVDLLIPLMENREGVLTSTFAPSENDPSVFVISRGAMSANGQFVIAVRHGYLFLWDLSSLSPHPRVSMLTKSDDRHLLSVAVEPISQTASILQYQIVLRLKSNRKSGEDRIAVFAPSEIGRTVPAVTPIRSQGSVPDTRIATLGLEAPLFYKLTTNHIRDTRDLEGKTAAELRQIEGIGALSILDIRIALSKVGKHLADDEPYERTNLAQSMRDANLADSGLAFEAATIKALNANQIDKVGELIDAYWSNSLQFLDERNSRISVYKKLRNRGWLLRR